MKYQIKVPGDWIEDDRLSDANVHIVQLLIENWPDRPIPDTAFSGNEVHRDRLISMGWIVEVES